MIYSSGIISYQPTQIARTKKMKLHLLLAIASFFLHESCGYPNPVESINGVGEWGGNGENNGGCQGNHDCEIDLPFCHNEVCYACEVNRDCKDGEVCKQGYCEGKGAFGK